MTNALKLSAGGLALTGVFSCSEPEAAAQYLAGMPLVYGTRLGQPWTGPSTCVPGVRAAEEARQDEGWDVSQLWWRLAAQGANLFGVPLVPIRSRRGCR